MKDGADPKAVFGDDQMTALMEAARLGKVGLVNALGAVSDKEQRDVNGWTLLMYAVLNPNIDSLMACVKFSDPEARDNMGRTAMIHAARMAVEPAAKALLGLPGADARDKAGRSALDWALERNTGKYFPIVRMLRESGKFKEGKVVRRGM